jgi:hypothetical protein
LTGTSEVPIATGNNITFATGGSIEVAGDGKVYLPNTEFGAGTYTAAGAVTITAKDAGDEIATSGAGNDTNGLTIGGTAASAIILRQGAIAD